MSFQTVSTRPRGRYRDRVSHLTRRRHSRRSLQRQYGGRKLVSIALNSAYD